MAQTGVRRPYASNPDKYSSSPDEITPSPSFAQAVQGLEASVLFGGLEFYFLPHISQPKHPA